MFKAFAVLQASNDTIRIIHFLDFGPSSRSKYPLPQSCVKYYFKHGRMDKFQAVNYWKCTKVRLVNATDLCYCTTDCTGGNLGRGIVFRYNSK